MRRAVLVLTLLAVVLLPGCPAGGSNLAGTWILSIGNADAAINLMPNGDVTSTQIDFSLAGTITWHTHGDQFIMDQIGTNGDRVIYSGLISNDGTRLDGARVEWFGNDVGLASAFQAEKT